MLAGLAVVSAAVFILVEKLERAEPGPSGQIPSDNVSKPLEAV
jgi:hypothetical protein